jgi:hypothetical protein
VNFTRVLKEVLWCLVTEQVRPEIPVSKFAHIRTLVKYGMTVSQVAEVYGVAVGAIQRVLGRA